MHPSPPPGLGAGVEHILGECAPTGCVGRLPSSRGAAALLPHPILIIFFPLYFLTGALISSD